MLLFESAFLKMCLALPLWLTPAHFLSSSNPVTNDTGFSVEGFPIGRMTLAEAAEKLEIEEPHYNQQILKTGNYFRLCVKVQEELFLELYARGVNSPLGTIEFSLNHPFRSVCSKSGMKSPPKEFTNGAAVGVMPATFQKHLDAYFSSYSKGSDCRFVHSLDMAGTERTEDNPIKSLSVECKVDGSYIDLLGEHDPQLTALLGFEFDKIVPGETHFQGVFDIYGKTKVYRPKMSDGLLSYPQLCYSKRNKQFVSMRSGWSSSNSLEIASVSLIAANEKKEPCKKLANSIDFPVFKNGIKLGMSSAEVDRILDELPSIKGAEIERGESTKYDYRFYRVGRNVQMRFTYWQSMSFVWELDKKGFVKEISISDHGEPNDSSLY